VSIRRACELLGVNQATLRHWTDAGKVRAYVTPGGHRRYLEDDLRRLTDESRPAADSLSAAFMSTRERYEHLERRGGPAIPWFQELDEASRQRFRILGSSMLHLVNAYVIGSSKRDRERSLRDGCTVAAEYGQQAAHLGLSLRDAMQAFLFFRQPVLESVTRWLGDQPARGPGAAEALVRLNHFMDQVLLAMATAHEASSAQPERAS